MHAHSPIFQEKLIKRNETDNINGWLLGRIKKMSKKMLTNSYVLF